MCQVGRELLFTSKCIIKQGGGEDIFAPPVGWRAGVSSVWQGPWKDNDWQTMCCLQFPCLLGGMWWAWTILKLHTDLSATAFLRPSAKMAARRSSCGQAPPRPGCLLKTQEKAHEARRGQPPMCPEPRSGHSRPAAQRLFRTAHPQLLNSKVKGIFV